jgi:hypothetical protein
MAAQLTAMKGSLERAEIEWRNRAQTSLPTPVSPDINTGVVKSQMRRRTSSTLRISGETPRTAPDFDVILR